MSTHRKEREHDRSRRHERDYYRDRSRSPLQRQDRKVSRDRDRDYSTRYRYNEANNSRIRDKEIHCRDKDKQKISPQIQPQRATSKLFSLIVKDAVASNRLQLEPEIVSNEGESLDKVRSEGRIHRQDDDARPAAQSMSGNVVKDTFSTGFKPDVISSRDLPYWCKKCPMKYMMATQLSDHLRIVHGTTLHASHIKPTTASDALDLWEGEVDGEDEDD